MRLGFIAITVVLVVFLLDAVVDVKLVDVVTYNLSLAPTGDIDGFNPELMTNQAYEVFSQSLLRYNPQQLHVDAYNRLVIKPEERGNPKPSVGDESYDHVLAHTNTYIKAVNAPRDNPEGVLFGFMPDEVQKPLQPWMHFIKEYIYDTLAPAQQNTPRSLISGTFDDFCNNVGLRVGRYDGSRYGPHDDKHRRIKLLYTCFSSTETHTLFKAATDLHDRPPSLGGIEFLHIPFPTGTDRERYRGKDEVISIHHRRVKAITAARRIATDRLRLTGHQDLNALVAQTDLITNSLGQLDFKSYVLAVRIGEFQIPYSQNQQARKTSD